MLRGNGGGAYKTTARGESSGDEGRRRDTCRNAHSADLVLPATTRAPHRSMCQDEGNKRQPIMTRMG